MSTTKAHCNQCGGDRNHGVLHSEKSSWSDEEENVSGSDTYETLKCLGCENIRLRHTSSFSEDDEATINYFPPAIFRQQPAWFNELWRELSGEDDFVEKLLKEIYVALRNNLPSLAAMGVRSLIEKVMVSKTADKGTFAKNLDEFEQLGYVSRIQRERLEAILEAGHATIHRAFTPSNTRRDHARRSRRAHRRNGLPPRIENQGPQETGPTARVAMNAARSCGRIRMALTIRT